MGNGPEDTENSSVPIPSFGSVLVETKVFATFKRIDTMHTYVFVRYQANPVQTILLATLSVYLVYPRHFLPQLV